MGNIKLHTNVSNIANHTWNLDHKINFDDRHVALTKEITTYKKLY